jgi:short-subunit dehydrogenase
VRDYAAAPDLYAHIQREFAADGAELRLLVYAAGIMPSAQDGAWSFEDERATVETNTIGAMRWLDLGAETFSRQGSGALVGVSSVAGDRGRKGASAYMASKAALSVYLESLRYRLHAGAGKRVRVVTVKPGYVATPLLADTTPPAALVASAASVARRIASASERGPEVVYVPGWWALVMAGVRALPGFAMTRLPI